MIVTEDTPKELIATCPKCKNVEVRRKKKTGRIPYCFDCFKKTKHCDKNGNRTPNKAIPFESLCQYCNSKFLYSKKRNKHGTFVCENCIGLHKENLYQRKKSHIIQNYRENVDLEKRKRLSRELPKVGLSIEWYDLLEKKCGICGTCDFANNWCLDHDHNCCPYGEYCSKCVRGILCERCNVGLGGFKENTESLLSAIGWIMHQKDSPQGLGITCLYCENAYKPQDKYKWSHKICVDCKSKYPKRGCRKQLRDEWKNNPNVRNRKRLISKLNKIGVSVEWYEKYSRACGICGCTDQLSIDHKHGCEFCNYYCYLCIRGLLCRNCNFGLGCFKDNVKTLEAAIKWLQSKGCNRND
ncbi:hypothetical protein C4577_02000 [Candidatus Parcubacteria bacterium]|nr:MAG: hypothetical protein C4577_02000 [Candidatus Parcubacteria bacterium]